MKEIFKAEHFIEKGRAYYVGYDRLGMLSAIYKAHSVGNSIKRKY